MMQATKSIISEDWEHDILGNRCRVFSGYAFKSEDFVSSGIVVVKIGNLQNGTLVIDNRTSYFPENKVSDRHQRFVLHKDDVLIALTGATTGKIAVVPPSFARALLNQRVGKFEINRDKLNQLFFRFYALTGFFQKEIKDNILQSAQGNVSPQKIESFEILIPRVWEQRKIAYVLNELHRAIEQQEQIIAKTKELKRSLMHRLFTYGLRGEELKETEIGLMPRSWEIGSFESLCVNIKDSWSPGQPINGIYIGLEHIKSGSSGLKHFGDPKKLRSSKSIFYEGDILYGKLRPYLDKAVITNKKGICSTDILVFRPKNDVPAGFIVNLIHWPPFIEYAKKTTHGVNHPRTSWNSIRYFICGIPQHEEQQEIANILWGIDNKIEHEIRSKGMLNELFKSMLQLLMTGQVRVKDIDFGEINV